MAATPPVIRFSEFAVSGVSPSGVRHLQLSASGWQKTLGTGTGEYLDYGFINLSFGKQSTTTKAVVGMVDNMRDATEAVFNMRFWLSDTSDWVAGTYSFNGWVSGVWLQSMQLTDTSGWFTPTALPSGQNLYRQDGALSITASGQDLQVSQWVYLSVTVDDDIPVGNYGGNSGGFTYRLTYDYR
jgi:hypothetical protein